MTQAQKQIGEGNGYKRVLNNQNFAYAKLQFSGDPNFHSSKSIEAPPQEKGFQ
jgi:hypothetical protein